MCLIAYLLYIMFACLRCGHACFYEVGHEAEIQQTDGHQGPDQEEQDRQPGHIAQPSEGGGFLRDAGNAVQGSEDAQGRKDLAYYLIGSH